MFKYIFIIFPEKIICCGNSVKKFHSNIGFHKKKLLTIYNGYSPEILIPKRMINIQNYLI